MPRGHAGQIVHVAYLGSCVAGIIVEPGRSARVRLIRSSGVKWVGAYDSEGDFRHASDPVTVPSPDGTTRELPSWHVPLAGCES